MHQNGSRSCITGMDSHDEQLLDRIMVRIVRIRTFRRRVRAISFGTLGVAALVAIVPAWRELSAEAARSGFLQYASMALSDPAFAVTAWKDFLIVLAESIPAFGIAALAASILTFGASVRSFARAAVTI